MGSKSKPPPPPDTSRYSNQQFNLSQSMERMGRDMYEWGQQQQQLLGDNLSNFLGQAMPVMSDQFEWAKNLRTRFEEQVIPQYESLFKEAETYASKGEEDRQRGAAIQDVKSAMEAQRAATERKLEGLGGLDPSVVRNQAMDKTWGAQQAAVSALAANQAGERTKQIGRDLRGQAIDVGNTFLTEAGNAYNSGTNIGIAGLNAAIGTTGAGVQAGQGALPYYAGASGAGATGAGIVDTSYGRDLQYTDAVNAAESSNLAGLGQLAGFGMNFIPGVGPLLGAATTAAGGGTNRNPGAAEGGTVMAPGTPTSDSGALQVSDGEYVVPADVVRKMGTNHFDKMIEKETGRAPPSAKIALPTGGM